MILKNQFHVPFNYNADEVTPGVWDCRVQIPDASLVVEHIRIEALDAKECERRLAAWVAKQLTELQKTPKRKLN